MEVTGAGAAHPEVVRLWAAGFGVLPLVSTGGVDDGLLFWRWTGGRARLDTGVVWGDAYAVSVRLPNRRDWRDPFTPTAYGARPGAQFAEVVDRLLRRPVGDHSGRGGA